LSIWHQKFCKVEDIQTARIIGFFGRNGRKDQRGFIYTVFVLIATVYMALNMLLVAISTLDYYRHHSAEGIAGRIFSAIALMCVLIAFTAFVGRNAIFIMTNKVD
jgi:hypothetical protein